MGIVGDYGRTLQFGLRTHCHMFSHLRDCIFIRSQLLPIEVGYVDAYVRKKHRYVAQMVM